LRIKGARNRARGGAYANVGFDTELFHRPKDPDVGNTLGCPSGTNESDVRSAHHVKMPHADGCVDPRARGYGLGAVPVAPLLALFFPR
jgi:hypothetical protein